LSFSTAGVERVHGGALDMCGFVALYNTDAAPIDRDLLVRMTEEQIHRGPDDQGFATFSLGSGTFASWPKEARQPHTHEGGFGFNRLAIRDLSPAGHQPMATPDGRVVMVFNGEIYNADDERAELIGRGVQFRGRSDSEVLLYMYREYGIEETLARLNGMFAFVIADLDAQRIVLARDHFGIKPLYYWQSPHVFAAASEVKSFLQHPDFVPRLDSQNLAEHLAFRSCAGGRHLLSGVKEVEPGEWIELRQGSKPRRTRYWRPGVHTSWKGTFDAAVDAVEAAIERSVRRQLVSDVPVGCQFSAGVDSSLVSAFANRHHARGRYQTFSIIVDDARFNEEPWIERGERHLGVRGHRFTLGADEFAERLVRATWHLDEPLDHMNSIGILLLSERSRPHVTVLLSGEGADETFCGYPRFLRLLMRPALGRIAPFFAHVPRIGGKLSSFDSSRGVDARDWFIRASSPLLPEHLRALSGDISYEEAMEVRRAMFPSEGDLVARCRAYELQTFLVGLLKRQDKMTMAHSIENRVPLLDHEIVELVSSMPSSFCVDLRPRRSLERNTKRLLKAVTARHFPDAYVYRKKQGFGLPIRVYFRSSSMRSILEEVVTSAARRGLFDARAIRRWWLDESEDPSVTEALWIAIAFELWARQFLDGSHRTRIAA
jgi:asparagine synthase (glutamine-hydrolysing)